METYLILGLVVVAGSLLGVFKLRKTLTRRHAVQYALVVCGLFLLTAVFDNLIVGFGIVGYDRSKILGLYVGHAPVEDFFYPLVAAYVVPIFWSGK